MNIMSELNFIKAFMLLIACASTNGKVQSRLAADGPLYTERPPWLKVCRRSDPNLSRCLNDMFILMFPQLAIGIPEVNISPFEPLYIDKVSITKGAGPITLMGSFINLTVVGPSNATPTFTDLHIAKRKMHSGIYLPLLDITAQYNLKGKILVLPLLGHGNCELKLFQLDTKVDTDLSFPKVEGREILRIDHMSVNFRVGGMKANMHNLFNGNKVLGQTLNGFVNQNSQEVINELSESIGQSLGEILKDLMNEIFSKIPTDLWLPEEDHEGKTEVKATDTNQEIISNSTTQASPATDLSEL